ncbi:MAG: hypothetical protein Fur0021_37770 [Candidatus Promineifilaceae bacterium]
MGLWAAVAVGVGVLLFQSIAQPTIRIHWSTESELDVTGYNLYRADEPDGEFRQINNALLPPASDPFLGGEHSYIDKNVAWLRTYYYQLETIDRRGNATRSEIIPLQAQFTLLTP